MDATQWRSKPSKEVHAECVPKRQGTEKQIFERHIYHHYKIQSCYVMTMLQYEVYLEVFQLGLCMLEVTPI